MSDKMSELIGALTKLLPASDISVDEGKRERASRDRYELSPVLTETLPKTIADVVVWPRTTELVERIVELAYEREVPITPVGMGTGNYGQGVPFASGIVMNLSRMSKVTSIGTGWLESGAGTRIFQLEREANATGQELALMPSTVGSTIGGFLSGGSGGAGSIEHGWIWDGFAESVTVVPCLPDATAFTSQSPANRPFLHSYGTTGIITQSRVRLVPAQKRLGIIADFPSLAEAAAAGTAIMAGKTKPRLLSIDSVEVSRILGESNEDISKDRVNLRVLIGNDAEESVVQIIEEHGGRLSAVREDADAVMLSLAFNHVTERVLDAVSDYCHLQVSGEGMVGAKKRLEDEMPDLYVHLDGFHLKNRPAFVGIMFHPYRGIEDIERVKSLLADVDVRVNDPHKWGIHQNVELYREAAEVYDPRGLLNPGKLLKG